MRYVVPGAVAFRGRWSRSRSSRSDHRNARGWARWSLRFQQQNLPREGFADALSLERLILPRAAGEGTMRSMVEGADAGAELGTAPSTALSAVSLPRADAQGRISRPPSRPRQ